MDNKEPKNLLPEDEYFKRMSSLKAVKAPEDFAEKVRERIERRFKFEDIMRKLFVPVKIKVPLEIAGALAMIVLILTIFNVKEPLKQTAYAPKTFESQVAKPAEATGGRFDVALKKEMLSEAAPKEKEAGVKSGLEAMKTEEKPIELAFVIKHPSAPQLQERNIYHNEMKAADAVSALRAERAVSDKDMKAATSPYLNEALSKIRNQVELAEGKVISVENDKETNLPQYISVEIPSASYNIFLQKLGQFGEFQQAPPAGASAAQGPIRLRLRLSSTP